MPKRFSPQQFTSHTLNLPHPPLFKLTQTQTQQFSTRCWWNPPSQLPSKTRYPHLLCLSPFPYILFLLHPSIHPSPSISIPQPTSQSFIPTITRKPQHINRPYAPKPTVLPSKQVPSKPTVLTSPVPSRPPSPWHRTFPHRIGIDSAACLRAFKTFACFETRDGN